MMRIVAATKNEGKIKEFQAILGKLDITVVSLAEAGIDADVEETGDTFEKNALIKARAISMMCDEPVLADDSGLCVDALDGKPGVFSARYAGEGATDRDLMNKILAELGNTKNRKAKFVSAVALVFPNGDEITAVGEAHGSIVYEPQGENGFGYDPIFYSDELKKTFAQAEDEEKNRVSHRARALEDLYAKLAAMMEK
ncbi:MAG: XTP/dITP diphosphatase [Clostridia bacterium]|nr:XTP/dITP diphosphatase [Clostridia bacterium]